MSIGKSSIARAVASGNTATKTQSEKKDNLAITKFDTDKIGCLSVATVPAENDFAGLKESIKKRGVLCPVLVAATPKGEVWLLDGYRRLYAAKSAGISQIDAVVINAENKTEANRIYKEINQPKPVPKTDDIHQEKFRVLAVKDHDLPAYLL